jgi:hypothetical protein
MSSPSLSRLPLSMLLAGLSALAAPVAHADIFGSVSDSATQQPFPAEAFPTVYLQRCVNAGDTLCTEFTGAVEPAADGSYRFTADSYAPGDYQLWAIAADQQYQRSMPFTVSGSEDHAIDLALQLLPVKLGDIQSCSSISADGYCKVSYTLSNVSAVKQELQVWVLASANSDIAPGWSQYSYGNGSNAAMSVSLKPGKTQQLKQSIYVGKGLPKGAYTSLNIYASLKGHVQQTVIDDFLPTVVSSAETSAQTIHPAQEQKKIAAAHARKGALSSGAAKPGDRKLLLGSVVAADTGAPVPLDDAPSVRLMSCDQPDYDYCRFIEGDAQPLPEDGTFRVNLSSLPAGRYQIETLASSHYGYAYSQTFDAPVAASFKMSLQMPRLVVDLDKATLCSAVPLADCKLKYTLRNTTAVDQTVSLWLYTSTVQSESQAGGSVYSINQNGKTNVAPMTVTIPANQTLLVKQAVGMADLPAGAVGNLRLFVASAGDIADALAYFKLGQYTISAGTDGKLITVQPQPVVIIGAAPN